MEQVLQKCTYSAGSERPIWQKVTRWIDNFSQIKMKRGVEAKQWYVPGAISRDLRKSYKNKPFAALDLRFSEEEEESQRG